MNRAARQVRRDLRDAFGLQQEGAIDTGTVLTTPSTISRAQAVGLAKKFPLRGVLRDLGAAVARELANEMQAANLRAADYADFKEVSDIARDRVTKLLLTDEGQEFARSVRDHLKLRG